MSICGLEQQLQPKLNVPWVAGGGDAAEDRGAQKIVGQVEVWVIEEVEGLRTKLKIETFTQSSVLHQRNVQVLKAWAVENVATGVAEGSGSRKSKGARVEPLIRTAI